MILPLHRVFLVQLVLVLLWNAFACTAGRPPGAPRAWERWLLPVLAALALALLVDRLRPLQAPLLERPTIALAFPLALLAGVAQNVSAMRARGVRLSDAPVLLYNVGVGACVVTAVTAVRGAEPAPLLLYDSSVLQHLMGSHLAHFTTLSWHLPLFVRRGEPTSVPAAMGGLVAPAFAGFVVVVLVLFRSESAEVLADFALEPRLERAREGLSLGVLEHPEDGPSPAGSCAAWTLPVDDPGLMPPPDRPLVLELCAPEAWRLRVPPRAEATAAFLDAAERLAARYRPALLLPFPEPDGVAPLLFGAGLTPPEWRALFEQARARVLAASPGTRIGARISGLADESRALADALAAAPAMVDVLGPRLHPGSARAGGPALADEVLATWSRWRAEQSQPPALWVLAAGVSPLAYGEAAQARFVEGCVARASARGDVEGLLVEGWRDRGHTLGLLRPDGSPREAALAWQRIAGGR